MLGRKTGRPLPTFRPIPLGDVNTLKRRLASRVEPGLSDDECWNVRGALSYSYLNIGGFNFGAHRIAYAIHYGQPPATHHICHLCDNPRCINLKHLMAGEPAENARQAVERNLLNPPRGERCANCRMTEAQAREAFAECKRTGHGYRRIAKRLGLNPSGVKDLLSGRTWPDLTGGKPVGVTAKAGRYRNGVCLNRLRTQESA